MARILLVDDEPMLRRTLRIILEKAGPGGGNPYVEMTFGDEDHAWEWFSESYGGEPDEFSLHLELAA